MIKDGYYEGEIAWMRLKVTKLGDLFGDFRSYRTQLHHDVCS